MANQIGPGLRGGLMVCGTTSDAGKSHVVTGLCRLMARKGIRAAPFKAQNMALNSYVTAEGHEIGRAQAVQAMAAGLEPEVAMNPILLKPTGDRTSQVIVGGRPVGHLTATEYHDRKPALLAGVLDALADLRRRFDVVILEGAGSPAEINLLDADIVNLRVADEAGLPAVIVGDIDRGGVFAALYGTVALLPDAYRRRVAGFVINKFRGDPALLGDGLDELQRRSGVPILGVLPWVPDVALDAEDSLALDGPRPRATAARPPGTDVLDVAVIRFPRLSNVTDVDALSLEPGVAVRLVTTGGGLGTPDLVVLPGTKATVADLDWLRTTGIAAALDRARAAGSVVLGVCGGYQMLGRTIVDPVESHRGSVDGLGWLEVSTVFEADKITRRPAGTALGQPVAGYEIHHGRVPSGAPGAWVELEDGPEGASVDRVFGTSLHGLFEGDGFRSAFLARVAEWRGRRFAPSGVSFPAARQAQFDRLADLIGDHLDLDALAGIIASAAPMVAR